MSYFNTPPSAYQVWYSLDVPPDLTASDIETMRGAAEQRYVDSIDHVWRDDPLDNLRFIQVAGDALPALRGEWQRRLAAKSKEPMPPRFADPLAKALISSIPSIDVCPGDFAVFDHALIPTVLHFLFPPSLEVQDRIAMAYKLWPDMRQIATFFAAPMPSLYANKVAGKEGLAATLESDDSPVRWIISALKDRGGEVNSGSWRSIAYMVGTMANTLLYQALREKHAEFHARALPEPDRLREIAAFAARLAAPIAESPLHPETPC